MSHLLGRAGRCVVATVLVASFFLAVPAAAADRPGEAPDLGTRLAAWLTGGWDGWLNSLSFSSSGVKSVDQEGGYLDPNGGGRTGSCEGEGECDNNPPVPASNTSQQ
jgi:hypothetical protein